MYQPVERLPRVILHSGIPRNELKMLDHGVDNLLYA
jgi:hypothetical protein